MEQLLEEKRAEPFCQTMHKMFCTDNHYLDREVLGERWGEVGSGSDILLLQAPNSKFNSNLGSGAGGELDAHLHYFAFDNFCALPFLSSHTRFGFNRILSLKDVEGHC